MAATQAAAPQVSRPWWQQPKAADFGGRLNMLMQEAWVEVDYGADGIWLACMCCKGTAWWASTHEESKPHGDRQTSWRVEDPRNRISRAVQCFESHATKEGKDPAEFLEQLREVLATGS